MTITPAPTQLDVDRLQQHAEDAARQAAAAVKDAQAAQQRTEQERADRGLDYQRTRLRNLDRAALGKREREANRAVFAALEADPLVQAFVEWQAARLAQNRAEHQANTDAAALGIEQPFRGVHDVTLHNFSHVLVSRIEAMILDKHQAADDVEQAKHLAHVVGTDRPLTPAEAAEYGAAEEERSRRERAQISPPGYSVPAEGLTERAREDLGIPPSRPDRTS